MIVSIHAGHGGPDRGTQAGGIDEANYNFAFSTALSSMLHKLFYPSVQAFLVRDNDDRVPLSQAAELAADRRTALAFAVHVNAHTSANAHGPRIFCDGAHESLSVCTDTIFRCYPKELRRSTRKVGAYWIDDVRLAANPWLRRPHNVISPYTRHGIPCVLLELFFASNPHDYKYAHEEWVRQQMLLAVCQGVAAHAKILTGAGLFEPTALQ